LKIYWWLYWAGKIGATWNLCYIFTSGNIMVQQVNRADRQHTFHYKFLIQSMIVLHPFAFPPYCTTITCSKPFSHDNNHFVPSSMALRIIPKNARRRTSLCSASSQPKNLNGMDFNIDVIKEDLELQGDGEGGSLAQGMYARSDEKDTVEKEAQEGEDDDAGYSDQGPYTGRPEKDYDRDPELANILGGFLENPQEAQSQVSITALMV